MEKGIKITDAITCMLRPTSTRATNNRLEVVKEQRRKKEEMRERRKAEAMAAKQRRARGRMSLSIEKEEESDTGNNKDSDQAEDEYPLQLSERMRWKLQVSEAGYSSIQQVESEKYFEWFACRPNRGSN